MPPTPHVVPRLTLALFSLPAIMQSFMHVPAAAFLQGIYGKYFGLSLSAMATGIIICRVFDAVTDPLIGHASDVWHRKTGSRKPFLVVGAIVTTISLWFLYQPSEGVTIWYFTGWFMLAYLGWTISEIPYRAWSIELSHDYGQRARIAAWIMIAALVGSLAFYLIPYLSKVLGYAEDTSITPQTLAASAIVIAIVMPLATFIMVSKVPAGDAKFEKGRSRDSGREILRSFYHNGPLVRLVVLYMIVGLGAGTGAGIMFFFVDGYLKMGDKLALLSLLTLPIFLLATPFWAWVCMRFEKHRAMAFGMGGAGLFYLGQAFLLPGSDTFVALLILHGGMSFFFGALGVSFPAMLGDVVDYGTWRFGHERAGVYYSLYAMLVKFVGAIGTAIGLYMVDFFGFDPTATEHSESGIFGLKLAYAVIPGITITLAAPFLWTFPITRKRHAAILHAIGKRKPGQMPATRSSPRSGDTPEPQPG